MTFGGSGTIATVRAPRPTARTRIVARGRSTSATSPGGGRRGRGPWRSVSTRDARIPYTSAARGRESSEPDLRRPAGEAPEDGLRDPGPDEDGHRHAEEEAGPPGMAEQDARRLLLELLDPGDLREALLHHPTRGGVELGRR